MHKYIGRDEAIRGGLLLTLLLCALNLRAQGSITTYQYDNARTGQNTSEIALAPSNVNVNQFGKLFALSVDGQVYAQPLYVPNVAIPGLGTHNVLFVATEADSVFAFDADSTGGSNANPLWKASLIDTAHGAAPGPPPPTTVSNTQVGCNDLQPQIGITSTPVIDLSSGTIYVEAKSYENGAFVHRLHKLDITTGNEISPGPIVITATVSGTGDGSSGGMLSFDPQTQHSRPGMLLSGGLIYMGFASHCDISPYHGWLFAYDEATLAQKGVFNTTPNGGLGGIWMPGLAADASGNIFLSTGNGTFDTNTTPATDVGDSVLKLALSNGNLALLDYFTPYNQGGMASGDADLGSGGVLLLPDQPGTYPHLLVQAGKAGTIYLINRDQMTTNNTHYCSSGCTSDPEIVEEIPSALSTGFRTKPTYWNNNVYFWSDKDFLKVFSITNGLLSVSPVQTGSTKFGYPGATATISANGNTNGILWAIDPTHYVLSGSPGPAVLHAYDATNITTELYNSSQAAGGRDTAGTAVKFAVPLIANGKVYFGTATEVDVYGPLQTSPPTIVTQPANQTVAAGQTATFSVTANGFPAPTYQWQQSGNNISNATSASYTTPPTTTSMNGSTYQVVVTNPYGTVTSISVTLTVNPAAAALQSVSVNPTSVTGGQGSTGTVTLTGPAPAGGATVTLTSSNTAVAQVPASGNVLVPANASSVTFSITTSAVSSSTPVTIQASYNGVNVTATLTINPAGGSGGTISVVQAQQNLNTSTIQTSLTVNMTTTAGHLLVAFVREGSNSTDNFTVSDSQSQSWVLAGYNAFNSTERCGIFYMANSAAVTSVTAHYTTSGGVVRPGMVVYEIAGAATLDAGPVGSVFTTTQNSMNSAALTTSNANDILLFAVDLATTESGTNNSFVPGSGFAFTATGSSTNTRQAMDYEVVSSVQTGVTTTMSWGTATGHGASLFVAFK